MTGLLPLLRKHPLIAAVRHTSDLPRAAAAPVTVVFVLCGDINTSAQDIATLKQAGKTVFVHLDLVEGLGSDRAALRFLHRNLRPDGIISTRSQLVRFAAEENLLAIQRLFLVDGKSLETGISVVNSARPQAVEVLPGLMPDWVIRHLKASLTVPIVSGGLLRTRDDVEAALRTGVSAVSVSAPELWALPAAELLRERGQRATS